MRLTVFHDYEPEPLWTKSLNKLIDPMNFNDIQQLGHVHLAVFNDGVVGISVTDNNHIVYIKVRDITRRRGVGKYLLEETNRFVLKNNESVIIDTGIFPASEQDGLAYFLETQGYIKSKDNDKIFRFRN